MWRPEQDAAISPSSWVHLTRDLEFQWFESDPVKAHSIVTRMNIWSRIGALHPETPDYAAQLFAETGLRILESPHEKNEWSAEFAMIACWSIADVRICHSRQQRDEPTPLVDSSYVSSLNRWAHITGYTRPEEDELLKKMERLVRRRL